MLKNEKLIKATLSLMAIGFIIWFGGSVIRTAIAYDLFEPIPTIPLKAGYTDLIRMHSVYLFGTLGIYTGVGYSIAFIGALILFISERKQLKSFGGWVFMAFALFFLASPIEIWRIVYDIHLGIAIYFDKVSDFNHPIVQKYFIGKFKHIGMTTASSLSYLANITCVLYLIWRPLGKKHIEPEVVENEA